MEVRRFFQPRLVDGIEEQPSLVVGGKPLVELGQRALLERDVEIISDVFQAKEEGGFPCGALSLCSLPYLDRLSGARFRQENDAVLVDECIPREGFSKAGATLPEGRNRPFPPSGGGVRERYDQDR